jgi:para-nitrobenzyl esterase
MGQLLAKHFQIDGDDGAVTAALRSLSPEDIIRYQLRAQATLNPAVDGRILPDRITAMFARGQQHDVPYLAGANSWEWDQIATGPPALHKLLADAFLAGLSAEDLSIYGDLDRITQSRRWFAEGMFLTSTRYLAKQMAMVSSPAYLYHYTYIQQNLRGEIPGAPHGAEVAFLFGTVEKHPEYQRPKEVKLTRRDLEMGAMLRDYWIQFARTGDPNGSGRPAWPAYTASSDLTMVFDDAPGPRPGVNKEILDFHESRALYREKAAR